MLPRILFPFIWYFLRERKAIVMIFTTLALAAGFWGPFNSFLIKHMIDILWSTKNGDVSSLILPSVLIVLNFIVFDNFTWRGIAYIHATVTPIMIRRMTEESVQHTLGRSHQFYQDHLSGKISNHIMALAKNIEDFIVHIAHHFLRGTTLFLSAIVAAYWVSPIFCLILAGWFLLFSSVSILMSKTLVSLFDKEAAAQSLIMGELVDTLSNQHSVRIFSRKLYENFRMLPFLDKHQKAYAQTWRYALIVHSIQGGLITIMMACSTACLICLYKKNLVTPGDFALILGLSMETGHMMWFTMSIVDEFNKVVGRCKQSLSVLMVSHEIQDNPNAVLLQCQRGHILFEDVTFQYKNTQPLFEKESVELLPGQKIGLVGYSGSGKSTFAHLILRLYDVTGGRILIDGQDIRSVTQDSLRENIALIPQDPFLFQRSIRDNIRYGKIDANEEEVVDVAKQVHAHEFIARLPDGYNTLVGERGVKLSGGERQRIAIARAILKNAPILIVDEATSQLDSVTEGFIQESLWTLTQGKTAIVIAHRLSTLLRMDRILVLDKGKIIEDGTHTQLLAKRGVYRQLWDAQIGGFLGDGN